MRTLVSVILLAAVLGAAGLLRPLTDAFGPSALAALDSSAGSSPESSAPEGSTGAGTLRSEPPDEAVARPPAVPGAKAGEASADAGEEVVEPRPSTFYQWVDEGGSVHFAASLDEIPPAWRSKASAVPLDSAAFTRTASTSRKPARSRPVAEVARANRGHDVTVYTAPWCGWCRKTLAFLDERGVDYVNKDIESDPRHAEELRDKTGSNAIPLVEIDGNPIHGFDPQAMAVLLD